jgi:hypothetical protein
MSNVRCAHRKVATWGGYVPCNKWGRYEHEGKMYCAQHHPPTVAAKAATRHAEWVARYDADKEKRIALDVAAKEQARRAACFDDLLAALQGLVDFLWGAYPATTSDGCYTNDPLEQAARDAIAKATGEPT